MLKREASDEKNVLRLQSVFDRTMIVFTYCIRPLYSLLLLALESDATLLQMQFPGKLSPVSCITLNFPKTTSVT